MQNLPSTQQQAITLFDDNEPRSLVRLVSREVREAMINAATSNPEFFDKDERDLYKHLHFNNFQPSATDNRLRLKFWTEYDRVMATNALKMCMTSVVAGICSREYFYSVYLKRPSKLAWLLCPPTGYMVKAEEALEFGLEQLRDILEQPHTKKVMTKFGEQTVIDSKLGALKAHIVQMLDIRVKGAVPVRTLNLHANVSQDTITRTTTTATMEELEKQLKSLRDRERMSRNLPPGPSAEKPVIVVEPT
jgi:hypothetical protein